MIKPAIFGKIVGEKSDFKKVQSTEQLLQSYWIVWEICDTQKRGHSQENGVKKWPGQKLAMHAFTTAETARWFKPWAGGGLVSNPWPLRPWHFLPGSLLALSSVVSQLALPSNCFQTSVGFMLHTEFLPWGPGSETLERIELTYWSWGVNLKVGLVEKQSLKVVWTWMLSEPSPWSQNQNSKEV